MKFQVRSWDSWPLLGGSPHLVRLEGIPQRQGLGTKNEKTMVGKATYVVTSWEHLCFSRFFWGFHRFLQGGPLPVISGVITPINGRK